jgi:hypothetical protein
MSTRDSGSAIPPREGRVRAKRGGGEKSASVAGFSPPGRSLTLASTLPRAGRDETAVVAVSY